MKYTNMDTKNYFLPLNFFLFAQFLRPFSVSKLLIPEFGVGDRWQAKHVPIVCGAISLMCTLEVVIALCKQLQEHEPILRQNWSFVSSWSVSFDFSSEIKDYVKKMKCSFDCETSFMLYAKEQIIFSWYYFLLMKNL